MQNTHTSDEIVIEKRDGVEWIYLYNFYKVEEEIASLKKITGSKILKVIVETCYLTNDEKIAMCHAVTDAGADYIKTSTGFGTAGATLEDVKLFKLYFEPL